MLPLEIIDHIFSFLQSDSLTLEKCSKAHPLLSELVPKYLYANITIRVPSDVSRLSELASDNLIANYVRNLKLNLVWSVHESSGRRLLDQEKIALVLPKFRMLRGIALHVGDDPTTKWPLLHERFREAFTQCLRLPSMIEVSILGTSEFPLTTFRNCTSIKKLALGGELFDFDVSSSDSSSSSPQIESLSLYRCQRSSSAIISWAKTCSPRSLRFSLPSDFGLLQSLAPIYSNTLVSLELDLGTACMSFTHFHDDFYKLFNCPFPSSPFLDQSRSNLPPPSLFRCPPHKVEDLIIHALISFHHGDRDYDTPLPMIASFVTSAPSLKRLTLDIRSWFHGTFFLGEFDWSPLSLLCSSSLESIKLHVTKIMFGNVPSGDPLPCLEGNTDLMRMVKQGLLTIKTEEHFI